MSLIKGGYILQPRCIDNSWIAEAAPVVRETWGLLLRKANYKDQKHKGFAVKRGQLFVTYQELRDMLAWKVGYRKQRYNESQMKHCMKLLQNHGMITLTKTPRGSLVTICNYDKYQCSENYESTNESTNESTDESTDERTGRLPPYLKKEKEERRKKEKKENFIKEKKSTNKKRATQIPEDFTPSEKLIAWVEKKNLPVDVNLETESFINYHRAKGNVFKSHDSAWRNWMLNAVKFQKSSHGAPAKPIIKKQDILDRIDFEECGVSRHFIDLVRDYAGGKDDEKLFKKLCESCRRVKTFKTFEGEEFENPLFENS